MATSEELKLLIERGDLNGVDEFIKKGGVVDGYFQGRDTPLTFAIECSYENRRNDVVKVDGEWIRCQDAIILRLIDAGVDVNSAAIGGNHRPLVSALVYKLNYKVIYKLINAGADINVEFWTDYHILLMYAINGNYDKLLLNYLIRKGARVNCRDGCGFTPLHFALKRVDRFEIATTLIDAGAIVNTIDNDGANLFRAVKCGGCCGKNYCETNGKLIKLLLNKGVDLKLIDSEGKSIIHYTDCNYLISLCIKSGLSVNVQDECGSTPLADAMFDPNTNRMKSFLFQFGADANCVDFDSKTVLHLATQHCSHDVCHLLLYCGVDLYVTDGNNKNVFDYISANISFNVPTEDIFFNSEGVYYYKAGIIEYHLLYINKNDLINRFRGHNFYKIIEKAIHFCEKELEKMKNTFLKDGLSFYEFCVMRRFHNSKLVDVSADEFKYNYGQIEKMFPIYHYAVILRLKHNQQERLKRRLRYNLENIFIRPQTAVNESCIEDIELGFDCKYLIAGFLDYEELYDLFLAAIDNN